MFDDISHDLTQKMPELRGRLLSNAPLAPYSWLRVGGSAQALFTPKDEEDLGYFLENCPSDINITTMGVGSNLIIRDGGIEGVVIRLGPAFGQIEILDDYCVRAGAATLDKRVAVTAGKSSIDGFAFLSGVPGAIGGALRMNAGAHGGEVKDILHSAIAYDRQGKRHMLNNEDFNFSYRHTALPGDYIFTSAIFQGYKGESQEIQNHIDEIERIRIETQPIKSRTAGSTFKNPKPHSSWKLIDEAGGRGLNIGDAQMSEMHCNFLLNNGDASAFELESLGELIRKRVFENSGILLEWEVKRIGNFAPDKSVKTFAPTTAAS